MKIPGRRLALFFALLFASAAHASWWTRTIPSREGYRRKMQSWLNHSPDELLRNWGVPAKTLQMPNGNTLYVFRAETVHQYEGKRTTTYDPSTHQSTTQFQPPSTDTTYCESQFEVEGSRIVSWRYEGSECLATYDDDEPEPAPIAAGGALGVQISDVDEDVAARLELADRNGALVISVKDASGAKAAGIRALDVIREVDGEEVKLSRQLPAMIQRHRPGERVRVSLVRSGKVLETVVTLRAQ